MGADEVRVELAAPEALDDAAERAACEALLSPAERERAAQIRAPAGRQRFVAAHALARRALSRAAPVAPGDWIFCSGPHGKPEIAGPGAGVGLRFNLSHTDGLAACAVVRGLEVGVDVEAGLRLGDPLALAERFFAGAEIAALRALEPAPRRRRFLDLWSLKEALLKALGVGIAGHLASVCFAIESETPRVVATGDVAGDPRDWQLALLRPTERHRVALALRRGQRADLRVAVRLPPPPAAGALSDRA